MFFKIGAVLIIITVSYLLAIFLAPTTADELAKVMGITDFNTQVRTIKQKLDATDSFLKYQDQSGSLIDGSILDSAKNNIESARVQAEKLRGTIKEKQNIIEEKIQQANQIVDTASSLKNQINTFTTLTGTTAVGANLESSSGNTLSGSDTSTGISVPNR